MSRKMLRSSDDHVAVPALPPILAQAFESTLRHPRGGYAYAMERGDGIIMLVACLDPGQQNGIDATIVQRSI